MKKTKFVQTHQHTQREGTKTHIKNQHWRHTVSFEAPLIPRSWLKLEPPFAGALSGTADSTATEKKKAQISTSKLKISPYNPLPLSNFTKTKGNDGLI